MRVKTILVNIEKKLSTSYIVYMVGGLLKSEFIALALFLPFHLLTHNLSYLLYY